MDTTFGCFYFSSTRMVGVAAVAAAALNPQHVTMETWPLSSDLFHFFNALLCLFSDSIFVATMNVESVSKLMIRFASLFVFCWPYQFNAIVLEWCTQTDFDYNICGISIRIPTDRNGNQMRRNPTTTTTTIAAAAARKNPSKLVMVCQLININLMFHWVVHYDYYCAHLKCRIYWSVEMQNSRHNQITVYSLILCCAFEFQWNETKQGKKQFYGFWFGALSISRFYLQWKTTDSVFTVVPDS